MSKLPSRSQARKALPDGRPRVVRADQRRSQGRRLAERGDVFALLVNSVRDYAIVMLDVEGRIASWNTGAERITGYKEDEIVGRSFVGFYTPEDIEAGKPREDLRRAAELGAVEAEGWRVRKDGSRFWANNAVTAVRESDGRLIGYAKVTRDLTERLEARATEFRLRQIADVIPTIVWVSDAEGNARYFNRRWSEYTGLSFDDSIGRGWEKAVCAQDVDRTLGFWCKTAPTGAPFEKDIRLRSKDGEERWFLCRGVPLRGPDGTVTGYFGVDVDIEEKVRGERSLEEAVQERTQRLQETIADLESFSYTASHDLRAPLRAMAGYAEILLERLSPLLAAEDRVRLDRLTQAARRMDTLITDLLTYETISREPHDAERIDLDDLLRTIAEHEDYGSTELSVQGALGAVRGRRTLVAQALGNLLANARKFVRPGRPPNIEVRAERRDAVLRVVVSDRGIGLDPALLVRIFKPFERGDVSDYPGTGIGLAIVKKSIERLGGAVGAELRPGGGSSFWFELPEWR